MAYFKTQICILFLGCVAVLSAPNAENQAYYNYEYSNEDQKPSCDDTNCNLPDCSCFGSVPNIPFHERPQFVMLTFDDAITVSNIDTYKKIMDRVDAAMTFFVCHEYNDYTLTNMLYKKGHEIAVHTISHRSNTDLWRHGSAETWTRELVGMRTMLSHFAKIPESEVTGQRAPFLQTAGNVTFRVLKKEGFLYDSSVPTRAYMDPPLWPYTLDHGFAQDCQIEPCPNEQFPGLWMVPMVQYKRTSKFGEFFCSMVDACTPQPTTAADTKDFLMENFLRHYHTNKAPFPVFLHEGWLREKQRLEGYLQFLEEISKKEGVFLVTVRDVIEYMKKPVPATRFSPRSHQQADDCPNPETCSYKEPLRFMKSCVRCPPFYPWVGTPLGGRPPKDIFN